MPLPTQAEPGVSIAEPPARRTHIFVLIDALGWEYLRDRSFLNDILPYRRPLRTVLGFSSGAIPTILTGAWPSVTGHWNLFYYDPKGSPFRWLKYFGFLPDFILNCRVASKILKELGRHVLGLGSLFDCCVSPSLLRWFNFVEKKNIYKRGGISGAPSIFDHLEVKGVSYRVYTYHDSTDPEIFALAAKDLASRSANFYFVYLSEMDMFLHTHCSDQRKLDEKIDWYEAELRRLYSHARGIDPQTSLTILSDHGMTPVRNHYDLMKQVASAGYKSPGDYLAIYDSTMARFWFFSQEARRELTELLGTVPCGRILNDQELQAFGVFFEDRRFGEVIFLLEPGWIFSKSDFNGPQWKPAGMHGYHPDDPYSDGIFLTNLDVSGEIRTIADVYQNMYRAGVGAGESVG
jgi:predicted AlkP superfamily pyrophosphatase or phosphodiesterase